MQDLAIARPPERAVCERFALSRLNWERPVLLTGSNGFLGSWMRKVIAQAGLSEQFVFLVRDLSQAASWNPQDRNRAMACDNASLGKLIEQIRPAAVFHFAQSSSAAKNAQCPFAAWQEAAWTANAALACAKSCARMVYASSGAVYGPRTAAQGPCPENQPAQNIAIAAPENAYAVSKISAENALACLMRQEGLNALSLRLFAFAGSGLPLDSHFAAGNFALACASGHRAKPQGDGKALRTYLHPADAAAYALMAGADFSCQGALNVGSPEPVSILRLSHLFNALAFADPEPDCPGPAPQDPAYWPDMSKALSLGLAPAIPLRDALADLLHCARAFASA